MDLELEWHANPARWHCDYPQAESRSPPSLNILQVRKEEIEVMRLNILNMKEKVVFKGAPSLAKVNESWSLEEPRFEVPETT